MGSPRAVSATHARVVGAHAVRPCQGRALERRLLRRRRRGEERAGGGRLEAAEQPRAAPNARAYEIVDGDERGGGPCMGASGEGC